MSAHQSTKFNQRHHNAWQYNYINNTQYTRQELFISQPTEKGIWV